MHKSWVIHIVGNIYIFMISYTFICVVNHLNLIWFVIPITIDPNIYIIIFLGYNFEEIKNNKSCYKETGSSIIYLDVFNASALNLFINFCDITHIII